MMRTILFFVIAPAWFLLTGCINMDADGARKSTSNDLLLFGTVLQKIPEGQLIEIKSFDDFLVLAEEKGVIVHKDLFRRDGWRRSFHWRVVRKDNHIKNRIISAGKMAFLKMVREMTSNYALARTTLICFSGKKEIRGQKSVRLFLLNRRQPQLPAWACKCRVR